MGLFSYLFASDNKRSLIKIQKTIDEINPKKIVYVSCNPATLARDLKILDGYGYKADIIYPVDMFPKTSHIECVVKLYRK